jgi:anthranilate phosphoribosyltransferase
MVVNSNDGLDELSISASTNAIEVHKGKITEMLVSPQQLGLTLAPIEDVTARDLAHAVKMIKGVLAGSAGGAPRDMALLNAAATLLVGDVVESLEHGVEIAYKAIKSGAAMRILTRLASDFQ